MLSWEQLLLQDEELFLMFDDFVIQNKAKDTKATTFGTGAQLDGAMTAQIMSLDPIYHHINLGCRVLGL